MYDRQPTLALLTAYTRALEREQLDASMRGQQAMQQAANTRGTIADEIMSRPVMAASGGIMQGYAGGGAVAFQDGGNPEIQRILKKSPLMRTPEENEKLRAAGIELTSRKFAAPSYSSGIDEVLAAEKARTPTAMTAQQMEAAMQSAPAAVTRSPSATRPGTGIAQPRPQQRPPAAPAAAAPADTGLAGLMGPTIDPGMLEMRGAVADRQAAIRNAAKTPEDVLKAQSGIDALMKEIVDARRAEEQRLMTHSDKRLEEARARATQSPLTDISYLGQMLEGMRGSKRFGEALAGAASGAGRAQTARSQALQAAEEKYDLSRRDIFNLANLRQQVQLDQAKLAEARATGNADRANKAALDLAQSREALAKFEIEVQNKSREFGLEERKLTQQAQLAREQMKNAVTVAGMRGSGELTESQKANLREKATDNVRQDKNLPLLLQNAKVEAQKAGRPFDQQKFIDTLIQREYNRIVGKETPAAPAAGGIDPDILKLFKVTPVGG
jgi:hypothetical protein